MRLCFLEIVPDKEILWTEEAIGFFVSMAAENSKFSYCIVITHNPQSYQLSFSIVYLFEKL